MSIEQVADEIRTMKVHGAGRIARTAAQALADHAQHLIETEPDASIETLREALLAASQRLFETRPTAVSLGNGLRTVERAIRADAASAAALVDQVVGAAEGFCTASRAAVEQIGRIGAKRIRDGFLVQTHCNSKAAMAPLKAAYDKGVQFRAQATETRPKHQGYKTARELAEHGLDVSLIVDSAVRFFMRTIDVVFVGADTIMADGTLVNKIGTSQIALAAHEHNVPFYVCAETYKFSPATLMGDEVAIEERDPAEIIDPAELAPVKLINPVFDFTPPRYITAIITEAGMIPPQAAYQVIRQMTHANNEP